MVVDTPKLLTGSMVKTYSTICHQKTSFIVATYHAGFHGSNSLIFCIVWNVRSTMEKFMNTMSSICADGTTAICPCNRFTG